MRASAREEVELAELWEEELIDRRVDTRTGTGTRDVWHQRPQAGVVQQFATVDDLEHAPTVRAVAEVNPILSGTERIAVRPERDRPVEIDRGLASGAGLLPDETEVAQEHGIGRIAEIVDLRHAADAPALGPAVGDEVADPGVAFPPALVR